VIYLTVLLTDRTIIDEELNRVLKEAAVTYCKVQKTAIFRRRHENLSVAAMPPISSHNQNIDTAEDK
jgi:hypothetical protein